MGSVAVVIVTFNSAKHILTLLGRLFTQTLAIDRIIIVDNHSSDETCQLIKNLNKNNIILHELPNNQGGAGGFYQGLKMALEYQSEYIFTFDDDALPSSDDFIKNMLAFKKENQAHVVSPLVIDAYNHQNTAYEYKVAHQKMSSVSNIQNAAIFIKDIKLFNGVLFDKLVLKKIGLPKPEFFIRGDEQEFRERILANGLIALTATKETVYHPASVDEYHYIKGRRYHHVDNVFKQFYSTRNRFYMLKLKNISSLKKAKIIISEWYRYTWFYLCHKKDLKGYVLWLKAMLFGLMGYMKNNPDAFRY